MTDFYSQFAEDRWIVDNLLLPDKGFFVEIGCGADGLLNSNTKYFENIGWDGFVIEADPSAIPLIKENRECDVYNYAISSAHNTDIDFFLLPDKQLSGILRTNGQKIKVLSKSIDGLVSELKLNNNIDLMSIDVEGTEIDVLNGMNHTRPRILIVEYNTVFIRNDIDSISSKVSSMGYIIKHITGCNIICEYTK